MKLSIIVPMLNEAAELPTLLPHLKFWEAKGCEIILVDGGSHDGSAQLAEAAGSEVVRSARGRARQMNAGARHASGDVYVFLHADTRLPVDAVDAIRKGLRATGYGWGRFDVHVRGNSRWFAVIAFLMNWRSRLTGIATGDQAIFVRKVVFWDCGGFPDQPLMEDIQMSRRLKRYSPPLCLRTRATTSGRRWEAWGFGERFSSCGPCACATGSEHQRKNLRTLIDDAVSDRNFCQSPDAWEVKNAAHSSPWPSRGSPLSPLDVDPHRAPSAGCPPWSRGTLRGSLAERPGVV